MADARGAPGTMLVGRRRMHASDTADGNPITLSITCVATRHTRRRDSCIASVPAVHITALRMQLDGWLRWLALGRAAHNMRVCGGRRCVDVCGYSPPLRVEFACLCSSQH
mmetsp:Transcript_71215/g.158306  ORF Transcript_71215/g.158306 Transcript_71215/m.158306 type:complete len:110 (-) Transcript_71215:293-622(-)